MNGDGCNIWCQIETGWVCPSKLNCIYVSGGDGILSTGEGCDDGNTISGDGCSSQMQVESGWTCVTNANAIPASHCSVDLSFEV